MRRRLILLAVATALAAPAAASPPEAATRFAEGNALYREGRFAEAAERYRSIGDLGVTAPEVEFNLGNAELKSGNVGRAILHYRRALRLDPGHENARTNLDYARSLTQDVKPGDGSPRVARWIASLRLGPGPVAAFLFGAWSLFLVAVWLWRFRWRGRTVGVLTLAASGGLVLLLGAALVFEWSELEGTQEAVVLAPRIDVRTGPGDEETVSFRLHEGTEVSVLRESAGWLEIHVSEELRGWAPASSLERI